VSRFNDDGDWDYGRYSLWERAMTNALSGRRGQAALADLEQALLALPQKRLIDGALACNGEVCAVGALVVRNRVAAGEDRAAVLADLERATDPEEYNDNADVTATYGAKHGRMAYAMAWRIAELNDEDCRNATPEWRYEYVLDWVRKAQLPASRVQRSVLDASPSASVLGEQA
jgi:hypothetical protein